MLKRILSIVLVVVMAFAISGCEHKYTEKDLYDYSSKEFELTGLWTPLDITEEAFTLYKDAGFNVFSFSNHDALPRSSENQYYLGSKRTEEALKICKKIGMDVYISYGDTWYTREIEGDEYFVNKPFTNHNLYEEYTDIIKGVRISDEPTKERMAELASKDLIDDFKKVYPNKKYMINLIPETAVSSRNYDSYTELLTDYSENIMSQFEKPYISVDCYLFSDWDRVELNILNNYNQIAKVAKQYNANTTMILQSSTGNEFLNTLSEADMRQQAYLAIAFGADTLAYYCYSVPDEIPYNYCMLEKDNKTPSELYYHVKTVNNEVQKFASAVLSYKWDKAIGVSGTEDTTYRVSSIEYDTNLEPVTMGDTEHYVSAKATQDLVVSRFTSDEYGEAYMLVNFSKSSGKDGGKNVVDLSLKDCGAVAVYGGAGFDGTPRIITLDQDGKCTLELAYGEGNFIVPLK